MDGIQNLSCTVIHLGEAIGPVGIAGLSNKFRIRQRGHMDHGRGDIRIERFVSGGIALDKSDGMVSDLCLHRPASTQGEFADLFGYLTFAGVVDRFQRLELRVPTLLVA